MQKQSLKQQGKSCSHELGREISKSELADIIKENENTTDKEILLPVKFIQPKVTTDEVNASFSEMFLPHQVLHFPHPVKTITTEA